MAIKIIKEGNKKEVFEGRCRYCGCEFEYEIEDVADTCYYQREGCDYHDIKCPCCGREVWIAEKGNEIKKFVEYGKVFQGVHSFHTMPMS